MELNFKIIKNLMKINKNLFDINNEFPMIHPFWVNRREI
jgi:hypothetical protein